MSTDANPNEIAAETGAPELSIIIRPEDAPLHIQQRLTSGKRLTRAVYAPVLPAADSDLSIGLNLAKAQLKNFRKQVKESKKAYRRAVVSTIYQNVSEAVDAALDFAYRAPVKAVSTSIAEARQGLRDGASNGLNEARATRDAKHAAIDGRREQLWEKVGFAGNFVRHPGTLSGVVADTEIKAPGLFDRFVTALNNRVAELQAIKQNHIEALNGAEGIKTVKAQRHEQANAKADNAGAEAREALFASKPGLRDIVEAVDAPAEDGASKFAAKFDRILAETQIAAFQRVVEEHIDAVKEEVDAEKAQINAEYKAAKLSLTIHTVKGTVQTVGALAGDVKDELVTSTRLAVGKLKAAVQSTQANVAFVAAAGYKAGTQSVSSSVRGIFTGLRNGWKSVTAPAP